MVTWEQLQNIGYMKDDIAMLERRIERYNSARCVADTVTGSSPCFPYIEHSIEIEGIEVKDDISLGMMKNMLKHKKEELEMEIQMVEDEILKIPFSEIRLIIYHKFFERKSYVEIMHEMGYNTAETPRLKLQRYLKHKKKSRR